MGLRTPLYDWHKTHGGVMVEFGGWDMPVRYSNITDEHVAVRTDCGLFDISPHGPALVHRRRRPRLHPARLHEQRRHDEGDAGPLRPRLQRARRHPRRRAGLPLALRLVDGRQRLESRQDRRLARAPPRRTRGRLRRSDRDDGHARRAGAEGARTLCAGLFPITLADMHYYYAAPDALPRRASAS